MDGITNTEDKVLTRDELKKFHSALQTFLAEIKWRRDLTVFEKRVKFKDMEDKLNKAEDMLADRAGNVLKLMVDKALSDVEKILVSGKPEELRGLKDIKIAYIGRYTDILKSLFQELVEFGLGEVKKEMKIEKEVAIPNSTRQWISAKAEVIASRHAALIKERVIFGALSGVDSGKTVKQILWDIRMGG